MGVIADSDAAIAEEEGTARFHEHRCENIRGPWPRRSCSRRFRLARLLLSLGAEAASLALVERGCGEPVISLKNVLVATDFGDASEVALAYGREFARVLGAKLHVIHVVEDISGRLTGLPNAPEAYIDFGRWQRDAVNAAEAELNALLSDEDRRDLGATAVAVIARTVAPAILSYAKDHRVDLIIAGTHGRGILSRVVMGSVAERLVRSAGCPVLTVHHPERDFVLPDALQVVATRT